MTFQASVKIINNGNIHGAAGSGGNGASGQVGGPCNFPASNGANGGPAITSFIPGLGTASVTLEVINYGLIAGGGGGGGGGGRNALGEYGGGGGGGAAFGIGGIGGGNTVYPSFCPFGCSCYTSVSIAQTGSGGTASSGGAGGTGASGGGAGGNGGGLAQQGSNGTGTNAGTGGLPGKATTTGGLMTLVNINGGQTIGVVD